jgi:hypothetical protein
MLYLIDASVLITAHNTYYAIDVVPEFWEWLLHHAAEGTIKMPKENFDECTDGNNDALVEWLKEDATQEVLLLGEDADMARVQHVTDNGYGTGLTDDQLAQIGNDPFLIAAALADVPNRMVVTTEVSRPSRVRHNRHIPDVCGTFNQNVLEKVNPLDDSLRLDSGWRSRTSSVARPEPNHHALARQRSERI